MKYIKFPIMMCLLLLSLLSHAADSDPLEGYEQVVVVPGPESPPAVASTYPAEQVERGRYLTTLLTCGSCHTDGTLIGKPDAERLLAGSEVGIARSNPLEEDNPGIVYPPNITPDKETGIGDWTLEEIADMLQSGINNHGDQTLQVMPWVNYSKLLPQDARSIAMYLKSLPPVKHQVPANVAPGRTATAPFVHFGIYRSRQQ